MRLYTTALKTVFLFFHALAQPYENGIPEKWDPEPRTLRYDPKVGTYGGTLRWDHVLRPHARALR